MWGREMSKWIRSLPRRIYTLVSVLSIVFFLATVTIWVRSYWREDYVACTRVDHMVPGRGYYENNIFHMQWTYYDARIYQLFSSAGRLEFCLIVGMGNDLPERKRWDWRWDSRKPILFDETFKCLNRLEYEPEVGWRWCPVIIIPDALPATVFGVLPAVWVISKVRRKRLGPQTCKKCGYDLRASPQRCPECGTAVDAVQTKSS